VAQLANRKIKEIIRIDFFIFHLRLAVCGFRENYQIKLLLGDLYTRGL